jgi:hypothetical protein
VEERTARVVDEDVDATELVEGASAGFVDLLPDGDVGGDRNRLPPAPADA